MRDFLPPELPCDRPEGLTRRDFARFAALLAAGAAVPFYNEFTLAQDIKAIARIPPDAVKLNANENPFGPCPEALEANRKVVPLSGRYLFHETHTFLKNKALVGERRQALAAARKDLFAWLDRKGYAYIPSEANMVLIDSKRPGRETAKAMLAHKVAIGRSWAALPSHVRVTIGTAAEMEKFKAAFERVVRA